MYKKDEIKMLLQKKDKALIAFMFFICITGCAMSVLSSVMLVQTIFSNAAIISNVICAETFLFIIFYILFADKFYDIPLLKIMIWIFSLFLIISSALLINERIKSTLSITMASLFLIGCLTLIYTSFRLNFKEEATITFIGSIIFFTGSFILSLCSLKEGGFSGKEIYNIIVMPLLPLLIVVLMFVTYKIYLKFYPNKYDNFKK